MHVYFCVLSLCALAKCANLGKFPCHTARGCFWHSTVPHRSSAHIARPTSVRQCIIMLGTRMFVPCARAPSAIKWNVYKSQHFAGPSTDATILIYICLCCNIYTTLGCGEFASDELWAIKNKVFWKCVTHIRRITIYLSFFIYLYLWIYYIEPRGAVHSGWYLSNVNQPIASPSNPSQVMCVLFSLKIILRFLVLCYILQ